MGQTQDGSPGRSPTPRRAPRRPRPPRESANPAALLAAARHLFAQQGPADVSIRQIAAEAGCSHTLVGRHFGSKAGLEQAVVQQFATDITAIGPAPDGDSAHHALWRWCQEHPDNVALLTRIALGELEGSEEGIAALRSLLPSDPRQVDVTQRFRWYLGLTTIIGLVAFRPFLMASCQLHDLPSGALDSALLDRADALQGFTPTADLSALPRRRRATAATGADYLSLDSRAALVMATIEMLSRSGPTSLTTRAIADLAQANQGLIYHYFASREDLFATAMSEANQALERSLALDRPLDLDDAVRASFSGAAIMLLARVIVNGVDISGLRRAYPVAERLIAEFTPAQAAHVGDPRVRAAALLACSGGAVICGDPLKRALGLRTSDDVTIPISQALHFTLFD